MVVAIPATLSAAALVVFLQYRDISTLQSQTDIILDRLSEQTAADIAAELHRHPRWPGIRHADRGQPSRAA